MTETMLERMANAIGRQMAEDENTDEDIARAALEAIREPDKDLIDTMDEHALQPSEWIWESAIDAILSQSQEGDKS